MGLTQSFGGKNIISELLSLPSALLFFQLVRAWLLPLSGSLVLCLLTHLCLTLCNPMGCRPLGSSVHGDSPGRNTRMGCHALLQVIFPTQESNPGQVHLSLSKLFLFLIPFLNYTYLIFLYVYLLSLFTLLKNKGLIMYFFFFNFTLHNL